MSSTNPNPNITLFDQPEPLVQIDEFQWRGQVESQTFLHTKVLWKGQHVLNIKKVVDFKPESKASTLDEDDEDYEPPPTPGPVITWLVQTEWEWLKYNYSMENGKPPTSLEEARVLAVKSVQEIFAHIHKAFSLRTPK